MNYKQSIEFRKTEEFLEIQKEIAEKSKEINALFRLLETFHPVEECGWSLFGLDDPQVIPTHTFLGYGVF